MIKKIAIISTLVSSLLYGESDYLNEEGFFIGLDVSSLNANISYRKKGSIITTSNYISSETIAVPSLKIGYQYYFTRVYGRMNLDTTYTDKEKDRFKIKNSVLEVNVDYLPLFYKSDSWRLRGVVGVGIGVNRSALKEYSSLIDVSSATVDPILDKDTQWNMEYGYQLGVMAEFDFGLSAELGFRVRSGLLAAFSSDDEAYEATFKMKSNEFYLGVNYLF